MRITVGSNIRRMCNKCNTPQPQAGGAYKQRDPNYKLWICQSCKKEEKEVVPSPLG